MTAQATKILCESTKNNYVLAKSSANYRYSCCASMTFWPSTFDSQAAFLKIIGISQHGLGSFLYGNRMKIVDFWDHFSLQKPAILAVFSLPRISLSTIDLFQYE